MQWVEPRSYVLHTQAYCKDAACGWSAEGYGRDARQIEEEGRDRCLESGHNVLIEVKAITEVYREEREVSDER